METGKINYHFVHAVFEWLKLFGFFNAAKLVYIVSDNAGKHFKNKATFEYIVKYAIELLIIIYWLMYALNHG